MLTMSADDLYDASSKIAYGQGDGLLCPNPFPIEIDGITFESMEAQRLRKLISEELLRMHNEKVKQDAEEQNEKEFNELLHEIENVTVDQYKALHTIAKVMKEKRPYVEEEI